MMKPGDVSYKGHDNARRGVPLIKDINASLVAQRFFCAYNFPKHGRLLQKDNSHTVQRKILALRSQLLANHCP